ncbi:uncharacterized protein F4822DRAFT_414745 [Hypoxylon trugodes]|uniref:uncharacterized protein n=1 Tax=Hypoxylon trugodes TaxID=326681 RepID=UPI00218E2FE2|nr:uncharacterized protein F4822DRAFT_414745 [Hypoxylon trugodes]KAI1386005.1 hypothetical protein F4822DRAFT_414745 [Hypoxylon trugodes]
MAPLCRYWKQGNCRNGASCRFEHPNANNQNPFGAPNANTNRFSALNTTNNQPKEIDYKLDRGALRWDLNEGLPEWLLSCYCPGVDTPDQLFGGYPREQSPEEVRLYIMSSGNPQQAEAEVKGLIQAAEQQNRTAFNDPDGAIKFILSAADKHPNRIDICKQSSPDPMSGIFLRKAVASSEAGFSNPIASQPFSSASSQSAFGGASSAFGQPSALGQKPNPFGAPSISASTQPPTMGSSNSVFGQPSQPGGGAPAFGQPSALGQKPNPFAAAMSSASNAFGQAAQSTFGQPSALGQRPNPFAAPTQPAASAPNPFSSQPAPATSAPNPFSQPAATNPFAQATNTTSADQAMDTSAPSPAPQAANNPFGKPSASPSPFGAPANNVFGAQKSPGFGAATANPFARVQTQPQAQPQIQPQPQATLQMAQNAQSQKAPVPKGNPYRPNSTRQHPPPESYINQQPNGRIVSFNGQPVIYKWGVDDKYYDTMPHGTTGARPVPGVQNGDGSWRKILFPGGPPAYNKDTEPDTSLYSAAIKEAYATMTATGRFNGHMPEVPPMREDCLWNF